ncbi:metal-binding protein [archaeon]|jgi:Zn-finger protein|nr:metal-binding protein [archaeon]MBT6824411.1 metal-binding protein [archaeon]MBT7107310.1 metal-binding protein [archaeon]MBT7297387.1 metal-binding protein [archaeon]
MGFKFFTNNSCEYFPCHDLDEDNFNCLFCYCPLYNQDCPGDYHVLKNGTKDCSECIFPHKMENYDSLIDLLNKKNKNYI